VKETKHNKTIQRYNVNAFLLTWAAAKKKLESGSKRRTILLVDCLKKVWV
jgi:hypothetical protein